MTIRREDIDTDDAVQGDAEPVLLVRSAWDASTWATVRADIQARIEAGQTPVIASQHARNRVL